MHYNISYLYTVYVIYHIHNTINHILYIHYNILYLYIVHVMYHIHNIINQILNLHEIITI